MKQLTLIVMVLALVLASAHQGKQSNIFWCPDNTEAPKKCVYLCPRKDSSGLVAINNGTTQCDLGGNPFRRCDDVCNNYSEFYYLFYHNQLADDTAIASHNSETFWCPDGTASTKKCVFLCPNGKGLMSVTDGSTQCSQGGYPFRRCDSVCQDNSGFYYSFYQIYDENPNIFWCPDATEPPKKCVYLCPNQDGSGLMSVDNGTKLCKYGGHPFRRCDAVCNSYSDFYYSFYQNQLSGNTSMNTNYPENFWCADGTAATKKCDYLCPNSDGTGLRHVQDGSEPCSQGVYPFRRCDSVCQDNSGFYYSYYLIINENSNIFWCPDATESPKKCVFLCPRQDGSGLISVNNRTKQCKYGGQPFRRCDSVCNDYSDFYYSFYQGQLSGNTTSINTYYPENYWCADGTSATKKCVYLCPNGDGKGLRKVKDGSTQCNQGGYPFRRCDSVCQDNSGFYYSFYQLYSENPNIFWCPDGTESPKKCTYLCPREDGSGLMAVKGGTKPCKNGGYPFRRCDAVCKDYSNFYYSFYQNQLGNDTSMNTLSPETYWCPDGTASTKKCVFLCPKLYDNNAKGLISVANGTAPCNQQSYPFRRCDSVCNDNSGFYYSFYQLFD